MYQIKNTISKERDYNNVMFNKNIRENCIIFTKAYYHIVTWLILEKRDISRKRGSKCCEYLEETCRKKFRFFQDVKFGICFLKKRLSLQETPRKTWGPRPRDSAIPCRRRDVDGIAHWLA